jgi:4'-phosphopantetheinyl transferase
MNSRLTVWRVELGRVIPASCRVLLSEDERSRAARFYHRADAERFTAMRAALRMAIGTRLATDPARIRFGYSATGKPRVESPGGLMLEFNVAHTRSLGLIALRDGAAVGVDLEDRDPALDHVEAVYDVLSEGERGICETLSPVERSDFLLHAWVAREAFVKAWGVGLGGIDLQVFPGWPAHLADEPRRLSLPPAVDCEVGWWIRALQLGSDYISAVVTAGECRNCVMLDWTWRTSGG